MSLDSTALNIQSLGQLLEAMWKDYCSFNPRAQSIYEAFIKRGESVRNDHIALRTLRHPKLGIDHLAASFLKCGYHAVKDYHFTEKKLYAWHFEHKDKNQPKIFISELLLDQFSQSLQKTLHQLVDQVSDEFLAREDVSMAGRPWELPYQTYCNLALESEYASWVAAYGFRPNHFTVSVNHLKSFSSLQEVNEFIKSLGIVLNSSGGEIKGSTQDLLEQSSTLAEEVDVPFSDGAYKIPACYYEFALRYPLPSGELYQGFVAASADKIFESTNRVQN